ncbi:MAG: hypothetical protein DRN71_01610 [Candidatus Nanohalarchaeota archaeon]|nr:MAG: hypothetical protein DRN71_01610 [Candidatus Nanohaloarchaeota archaeon]
MIAEYFLKVLVFVVVLRLLRVFDVQSALIYVLFCSASFFVMPMRIMPEFLVFCVFVFLFLYVILVSLRNALRTGFLRFAHHVVGLFYREKQVFYSVLLISFLMMVSGVSNWFLLFFGSFFGFLFLSWAGKKLGIGKFDTYNIFKSRNAVIVTVLAAFYYSYLSVLVSSVFVGVVYVVLFVIFLFVSDTFTFECPVDGLKEGMISAEYVLKKKDRYYRRAFHSITPLSFLRNRIMLKIDTEHVVLSPLRALSSDDIDFLKDMRKNLDFDCLSVQNTVDMRLFVVLGVSFVALFRFYFVIV